jgi:hypothetical protein
MSYKAGLIKTAMKLTPTKMIIWAANNKLNGIAELTDFSFDIETRKVYVQATLVGETDMIELSIEGFSVIKDGESYKLLVQQAQSNRPWLNNLLSRIIGKQWKIPAIPQFQAYIELISELFKAEIPTQEDEPDESIGKAEPD